LRGIAISSGILLPIVVLIVVVSMVAVRRGEAAMRGEAHAVLHGEEVHGYIPDTPASAAPAVKPAKPVIVKTEDVSVMEILILGLVLFGLTVFCLVGLSILQHLS
jgi:hypothetical protein